MALFWLIVEVDANELQCSSDEILFENNGELCRKANDMR